MPELTELTAEDRIAAALTLHVRVSVPEHHKRNAGAAPDICRTCWDVSRGGYAIWPCPTVQTLDPTQTRDPAPASASIAKPAPIMITPGGNPSCPVCGRWYGLGEDHACFAEKPVRIGDRVRLWIGPPKLGRNEYGHVIGIDNYGHPGVEIRFDQPPAKSPDTCYATHDEVEIVFRPEGGAA